MLLSFSALLYAYCDLHFLCLPQRQSFFSSWTKYSTNLKRHEWLFVLYIVSFSDLKMEFSKLSLAKYHCLHKNAVFTVISIYFTSCLPLLQNVFLNSFSFINSSVQIFLKLHERICVIWFAWLLFDFKISSYKSEEIELIWSFKNRIIEILMQKVAMISQCPHSD